jgi:hypothetical protein
LIDAGADLHVGTRFGFTPLELAYGGHLGDLQREKAQLITQKNGAEEENVSDCHDKFWPINDGTREG